MSVKARVEALQREIEAKQAELHHLRVNYPELFPTQPYVDWERSEWEDSGC